MLEIKDLSIRVNNKYLVKNLTLTLIKGDKLAIIGEEGNGKSTLLKSILGISDYAVIDGSINMLGNKIGYLSQTITNQFLTWKVFDYLFKNEEDYYNKVNELYKCLPYFMLEDSMLQQIIKNLSGGEKVKIGILKLLLEDADILFLDEPTNDLDINTLKWLENFINTTKKPIIYVSHDETLLANTANRILHLEQIKKKSECRFTLERITYDEYVHNRLQNIAKETQVAGFEKREFNKRKEKLQRIMQKVEHQQNTITRANPHGAKVLKKKMHTLKSQENKLLNTKLMEVPDVEEGINFFFEETFIPKKKVILKLQVPELKINMRILAKNIELEIIGNSHVCIIGKNGVGKTSLIKLIYSELKNREDLKVGYMPQNYADVLNDSDQVLDFIVPSKGKEEVTNARRLLGNMKFTREEMEGKIADLSNGTKAKLILMKLVIDKCNVLILDEPTRNVSPLSNPVIRKVLNEFQGAIISVSHDRKFIEEVITKLYLLESDGLKKINK